MAYPATLFSPPTVTDDDGAGGGTDLTASLIVVANDEIELIEAELGVEPHGSCGSVAERLLYEFAPDGTVRNKTVTAESLAGAGAPDSMRKLQCGSAIARDQDANGNYYIAFPEAFVSVPAVCVWWGAVDPTGTGGGTGDARCGILIGAPTTSGFNARFFKHAGTLVDPKVTNRLHWVAVQVTVSSGTV